MEKHRFVESKECPGHCALCQCFAADHESQFDPVEGPEHYCRHKVTTVQLIDDWKLDFFLGNTVKYIERHQLKGTALQDLRKAKKYLEMKIELMETGELKETIKHG